MQLTKAVFTTQSGISSQFVATYPHYQKHGRTFKKHFWNRLPQCYVSMIISQIKLQNLGKSFCQFIVFQCSLKMTIINHKNANPSSHVNIVEKPI